MGERVSGMSHRSVAPLVGTGTHESVREGAAWDGQLSFYHDLEVNDSESSV